MNEVKLIKDEFGMPRSSLQIWEETYRDYWFSDVSEGFYKQPTLAAFEKIRGRITTALWFNIV